MYGPTTGALLAEGAIALLHDYRSGHALDLSGNGNHGTLSAGCRFTGPAADLTFPATTDEVTVADAASLRLTAGSIIAVCERGFTSHTTYEYFLGHRSATGFSFFVSAGALRFYMDAAALTIATSILGKRSLGVSFTSGGTPIGYADGLSLGNFSASGTITATAVDTTLGNWANAAPLRSPLSAMLVANRILTPTEFAAVHAELLSVRWPSKHFSLATSRQGSHIGEAGLLAGFDLKPVGTSIPSHNGAFTGTVSGDAHHRQSILGDALQLGRVTGAVDLGVGNAQINPTTDSHWVEVWARPLDVAMVDAYAPIIGKGVAAASLYRAPGILHLSNNIYLAWADAGGTPVLFASGVTPRNKLTHFVAVIDHATHNGYLYIDGVQYGPQAIGTMAAAQATNWILGKSGATVASFDEGFGGLAVCPRIGTGVLTPAQVLARYALGARACQFKTDWGYSISAADEGGVTGQQIGGGASPFRAGDTTGRWRVETDTVDGRTCKALVCKTAGKVAVPASYFGLNTTPTEAAHGTFDLYAYKADASVLDANLIATIGTGITTGYGIKWAADESVVLTEYGVGNVIAGGTASHSAWHRFRVTRSIAGLFTLYIDGASIGTGTDTTLTTSLFMVFDMDAGDKLALADVTGDHSLVKYLGVVTP